MTKHDLISKTDAENEKMKRFSKIKFLESVGFLRSRFNDETGEFERSVYVNFKSNLIMLLKVIILLRVYISIWFKREDLVQLWIGNL